MVAPAGSCVALAIPSTVHAPIDLAYAPARMAKATVPIANAPVPMANAFCSNVGAYLAFADAQETFARAESQQAAAYGSAAHPVHSFAVAPACSAFAGWRVARAMKCYRVGPPNRDGLLPQFLPGVFSSWPPPRTILRCGAS